MARGRLLIIEDDEFLRLGMSVSLQARGFEVVTAGDGETAVSLVREAHPDVILLDLGLPRGGGYTVLSWLQNIRDVADTPVIVVSGQEAETHRDLVKEHGAVCFLQKPVDNEALVEAIENAMAQDSEESHKAS